MRLLCLTAAARIYGEMSGRVHSAEFQSGELTALRGIFITGDSLLIGLNLGMGRKMTSFSPCENVAGLLFVVAWL